MSAQPVGVPGPLEGPVDAAPDEDAILARVIDTARDWMAQTDPWAPSWRYPA